MSEPIAPRLDLDNQVREVPDARPLGLDSPISDPSFQIAPALEGIFDRRDQARETGHRHCPVKSAAVIGQAVPVAAAPSDRRFRQNARPLVPRQATDLVRAIGPAVLGEAMAIVQVAPAEVADSRIVPVRGREIDRSHFPGKSVATVPETGPIDPGISAGIVLVTDLAISAATGRIVRIDR